MPRLLNINNVKNGTFQFKRVKTSNKRTRKGKNINQPNSGHHGYAGKEGITIFQKTGTFLSSQAIDKFKKISKLS